MAARLGGFKLTTVEDGVGFQSTGGIAAPQQGGLDGSRHRH